METTAEEGPPTLHAVYQEAVYEVGMLGWHFAAIHAAWPHLLVLAALRTHQDEDPEARVAKILRLLEEPTIYFARDRTGSSGIGPWTQYTASHHPSRRRSVTWPNVS
jgi:hypothetical protein